MSRQPRSRLLRIMPAPADRRPQPTRARRVDESSGQIYEETVYQAPSATNRYWPYRNEAAQSRERVQARTREGPPSLLNLALRCVIEHVSSVTSEVLASVPWLVGKLIWERVELSGLDSVSVWLAFACAYALAEDVPSLLYRRQSIIHPGLSLGWLVQPVISPTSQWITFLSICGPTQHLRSDLANLTRIVNLGALDILNKPDEDNHLQEPGLNDSLVRSWARAARDEGAFSQLRVLILRNHGDITPLSLSYLSSFPALAIYNVSGCSIRRRDDTAARKAGWTCADSTSLLQKMEPPSRKSLWDNPIKNYYEYATSSNDPRPFLSFRLGGTSRDDCYDHDTKTLIFQRRAPLPMTRPTSTVSSPNLDLTTLEMPTHLTSDQAEAKRRPTSPIKAPQPKRAKLRDSKRIDVSDLLREFTS